MLDLLDVRIEFVVVFEYLVFIFLFNFFGRNIVGMLVRDIDFWCYVGWLWYCKDRCLMFSKRWCGDGVYKCGLWNGVWGNDVLNYV